MPKNELIIELFELNHKFIRSAAAAAYSTSTKTLFTILYFSMRRTIAAKAYQHRIKAFVRKGIG